MADHYEIGVKIGATSDDQALQAFMAGLEELRAEFPQLQTEMRKTQAGEKELEGSTRKTTKATQDQGGSIKGLIKHLAGWVAGLYLVQKAGRAMVDFVKDSIKLAKVQENAEHGLADALRLHGANVEKVLPQLKEYASQLQKQTGVGDEVSLGIMERLTRYGMEGEQLKQTTALVNDMTASGIDQRGAIDLLGRAYKGQTQALSRYGLVIKQGLTGQEKYNAVLAAAAHQWGGKAKEAAKTFEGRVKALDAAWGDFKETIGMAITKNQTLGAGIQYVTAALTGQANAGKTAEERTRALSEGVSKLVLWLAKAGRFATNMALGLEGVFRGIGDGLSILAGKALETIMSTAAKLTGLLGRFASHIPGMGKLAKAYKDMARDASFYADVGHNWADEGTRDLEDWANRTQAVNDKWDGLIHAMERANAEQAKASGASMGGAPAPTPDAPGGGATSKEATALTKEAAKATQDLAKATQQLTLEKWKEAQATAAAASPAKALQAAREAMAKRSAVLKQEEAALTAHYDTEFRSLKEYQDKITAEVKTAGGKRTKEQEKELKTIQTARTDLLKAYQIKRHALEKKALKDLEKLQKDATKKLDKEEKKRTKALEKELKKRRKDQAAAIKDRQRLEYTLYSQLMGLAQQYGGEGVQSLLQIMGTVQQLFQVWKTVEALFQAERQVQETTAALTSQTTTKASDVSQGTMNAELWAINAAQSVAAIPVVGWSMAPAVYVEALATGMAAVGSLASVPIGAGFDDPRNDAEAYLGGVRWGQDMVDNFSAGIAKGWAASLQASRAPAPGPVSTSYRNDYSRQVQETHIHALTGGQAMAMMTDYERRRRRASKAVDRGLIGKRRTQVGSARRKS